MKNLLDLKVYVEETIKNKKDFIPFASIKNIESELLISNDNEMLDYNYFLLSIKIDSTFYFSVRTVFEKRPKEIIEPFLLEKLATEKDAALRADVIQLLGNIRSEKILPYVLREVTSPIRDIRYRCIIVIGWVGSRSNLPVLNERLQNEPDDELRGYAATAMRQIWFKQKATSEDILPYLYAALPNESKEITLQLLIIVIQDLTKTKFGLQERINEATITGDAFKAKDKILKKLAKA